MSQETNLNVAPYFDDFNEPEIGGKAKDYYKVLFKPGFPVQARELTTLQSMLQNQVEQFGNHFFKEGAKVIPGDLTYIDKFYAVEIEDNFLGIPISLYQDDLVGVSIRGETSGVTAKIEKVISATESDRGHITLYVSYGESGNNNSARDFSDGENLITDSNITFGSSFITAGEGFSRTIAVNACSVGSAFRISEGVYFLRGYLVNVVSEILILDQYDNNPSYRIGLDVVEEIVNADEDPYLNDNANGFNNYAAPGGDRLKITASLAKKDLDVFDVPNFVELANVKNGVLRKINNKTEYNLLANEFARRTFDESGSYYVKAYDVFAKESLNDGVGNNGLYNENQLTDSGQKPSEDLMVYKVGPGKAYVRGFEVESLAPTLLDVDKPRTTNLLENQAVNFTFGSTLRLDRASGSPKIGLSTSETISLRKDRVGLSSLTPAGKEIGIARVYDYALESGGYEVSNYNLNRWDLSVYDVQTYGDLQINQAVTLSVPTHVKGDSSGATAFLKNAVSAGTALTVYQISGNFINGEKLVFDNTSDSRVSIGWTNYGLGDVRSVYSLVNHDNAGAGSTFSADVIPSEFFEIGVAKLTPASAGPGNISTVTSPNLTFPGIVTSGNYVRYTRPGYSDPSFAKVDIVNTNNIIISGITTVSGICDGGLSLSALEVTDLSVLTTYTEKTENNERIFAPLPKRNVSSVDLDGGSVIIRREFDVTITNNSSNVLSAEAGSNQVFLPFDEERYVLTRGDGSTEKLSSDQFDFTNGSTSLQINGLGANDATGEARLIATLRKSKVTSKSKKKSSINVYVVNKSSKEGSGTNAGTLSTTRNDGLTYGNYPYGTRVQDEKISLNVPDVIKIHGIYESSDTSEPTLPNIVLGSLDGPTGKTDDLIIGEEFVGTLSGARGTYAVQVDSGKISFVYLNKNTFQNGEIINFLESGVNAIASTLDQGSNNITDNYTFYNGQTLTYYDYSYLLRKQGIVAPTKSLKIVYAKGYYESNDTGDITTANSYEGFDYGTQIQKVHGFRNTDIIDARPRVDDYTVAVDAASPFEFGGRSFTDDLHSTKYIFASDESETIAFNYYLPRLDRIYLTTDGVFQVKIGEPADNPKLPQPVNDAINVANIALPPYLYDVKNAQITYVDHKRYQMSDIFKLENRIKNLEYYTTLSLLENNTANLFIADSQGKDRFKSGFLIDNFSSVGTQDLSIGVKNSTDLKMGRLRPSHYTTSVSLEVGSDAIAGLGTTTSTNADLSFLENITGTNIKRTGQVVSLDYDDVEWVNQPFATRTENVTPYLVLNYEGAIDLDPSVDVWIDVNRVEVRDVQMEGSFRGVADALQAEVTDAADGSRLGVSPVIWDAWQTNNVTQDLDMNLDVRMGTQHLDGRQFRDGEDRDIVDATVTAGVVLTTTLDQNRTGIQHTVREEIDTESLGDRIVSRNIIQFMRQRNISFTGRRMKPNTQVYGFYDNVDVNDFMTPKLLEIEMISGDFAWGENVIGTMSASETVEDIFAPSVPYISFRLAINNHKYGPFHRRDDIYVQNPYNRDLDVPSQYLGNVTLLNVDLASLADERQPEYWGWVQTGMILRGQQSGAVARLTNLRFITDNVGTVQGSYMVPDGNVPGNPVFETGRGIFRLSNSSTNDRTEITTSAEEIFYSQGDLDNTQEVTLSLRNARVTHQDFSENRTLASRAAATQTASGSVVVGPPPPPPRRDPLAQSFFVDDTEGVFITKVDVWFKTKDPTLPVFCQLREIQSGLPTLKVLPFADIEISSANVNVSEDASVATTVTFDSPVYLNGKREYALVFLSDSTEYRLWISRMGEADVTSTAQEAGTILVTSQPILGSLFKSQNASTWDPSQYEDMKFKLYRANFAQEGSVQFFNPTLPTDIEKLRANPIDIDSKTIRIGIGTTLRDTGLTKGNTIVQLKSGASGTYVGSAGTAHGTLNILNAGIGYTPSSGALTYSDITLTNVSGNGRNATANVTISGGVAAAATIANGGIGYAVGDVVTASSIGIASVGRNLRLSVQQIAGVNELTLDEVQGDFTVGVGYTLTYNTAVGVATTMNGNFGGNVLLDGSPQTVYDGLHFKVNQRNHGMHADVNQVTIKGAKSDVTPTTLSADYTASSTGNISVGSTENFAKFENVSVGATNPGLVKIGSEIIKYTGLSGQNLTGITRGRNGTTAFPHYDSDLVYKYEMDGVSLLRINKTHTLSDADISEQIGLDYYYLKVDMTSGTDITTRDGTTFEKLFFNHTKEVGGSEVKATYNVPFEIITPQIQTISPKMTAISASARTVSGQSINGSEAPYVDKGFQPISLGAQNYFDTPRLIASKVNEDARLQNLPGRKSFSLNMNLLSVESKLSPMIDLSKSNVIFTSNRINRPITDYVNDKRVNTLDTDPNAFYYASKPVILENSSSSIRLLLTGAINDANDIRAFYAIQNDIEETVIFTPFPGYANLDTGRTFGRVIDPSANNGTPNTQLQKNSNYDFVPGPRSFKEIEWSIDELPAFKIFRIKLIMTSTNQALVPVIQDLRAIALA